MTGSRYHSLQVICTMTKIAALLRNPKAPKIFWAFWGPGFGIWGQRFVLWVGVSRRLGEVCGVRLQAWQAGDHMCSWEPSELQLVGPCQGWT